MEERSYGLLAKARAYSSGLRTRQHGFGVFGDVYASGELDRSEWRELTDPLTVLAKWKEEGCQEKFYAAFRVPDTLIGRLPNSPQGQ